MKINKNKHKKNSKINKAKTKINNKIPIHLKYNKT